MTLSDQEVICTWMEPKPTLKPMFGGCSVGDWWYKGRRYSGDGDQPEEWYPVPLDLDALHLIEARLSGEQWLAYEIAAIRMLEKPAAEIRDRDLMHLSPEAKTTALAAVIRPLLESGVRS